MTAAGWTQAETARRLGLTSGAVNQFVKGTSRPSPTTLRLMGLLVLSERPEVMRYEEGQNGQLAGLRLRNEGKASGPTPPLDWESRTIEMLTPLNQEDREWILSIVASMVVHLSSRKPKSNSKR